MRKAAIIAAVVISVIALAVVLVPRLVSLDSMKPRIIAAMEEETGRKVSLSDVSLSLFPGIGVRITGLTVSGDPQRPEEPFLSVPEAEVRVSIGPLVAGRAEFSKVVFRRPAIHFHKYRDGTHSATDIANRLAKRKPPDKPEPTSGDAEGKVTVVLKSVSIEDADLTLRMEGADGTVSRWDISPFTFRLSGIGAERFDFDISTRVEGAVRGEGSVSGTASHERGRVADPHVFDVVARGEVFGQKMTAEGKMSAPEWAAEVDLQVSFPRIEVARIPSMLVNPPQALAAARPEGLASLSLKIFGSLQSMGIEAEADLTRAGWSLSEKPEIRKFIDAPFRLVVQGHYFPDLVLVSNAELNSPPLLLIANAALTPSTGAREWAVSSRIASLADFQKVRGGGLAAWSPAGRLTASGSGKRARAGAAEQYEIKADLGDVGFVVPGRGLEFRSLNGHLELTPRSLECTPLAGLLNGQRFSLRGAAGFGPHPAGQVDIRMAYLDADALFPPEEDARKPDPGEPKKKKDEAARKREVSVRANLAVDAGKARGVKFTDLKGSVRYDSKDLWLDSVTARVFGGEAAFSGRIGVGRPSPDFRVNVAAKGVAVGEILSQKTTLGDFLSGTASLAAELGGDGKLFADFARTGSGSGSVKVTDGTIKGVDLLATAGELAGIALLAAEAGTGKAGRGETAFTDLSADFQIDNGKIRTDALHILSEKIGLRGKTVIGFDRTIDFRGSLSLSRQLSDRIRGRAGKFLVGPDGRAEIPLVMSGQVASPSVAIDTASLMKKAGE